MQRASGSHVEQTKNTFDRACPGDYQSGRSFLKQSPAAWPCARSSLCPTPSCASSAGRSNASTIRSRRLMDDMIETMHEAPGVGLGGDPGRRADPPPGGRRRQEGRAASAASVRQSGDRVVVGGARDLRGGLPVNSGILRRGRTARFGARPRPRPRREACAKSWPKACSRPCLQHEIDHLDGVLFIDHISKLKRDRVIKKFQKAAKRAGDGQHVL